MARDDAPLRNHLALALLCASPLIACGDDAATTESDGGITTAQPSGGAASANASATASGDASTSDDAGTGASTGETTGPLGPCDACPSNYLCKYEQCVPDLGPCETNDDCPGDSYCDDGVCVPYGAPDSKVNDPDCAKENLPDGVTPVVQCEWQGPPDDDPTAAYTHSYSTPIVANLKLKGPSTATTPSIIMTTWRKSGPEDRYGMLRVFDGRTCEEQLRAGGEDLPLEETLADRPCYGTQWAVGDLDGDLDASGHPELVGVHRVDMDDPEAPAELYAFRIDSSGDAPRLERMWYGRDCSTETHVPLASGHGNHGASLIDLDDDGVPEIVFDRMVFDVDGCLLNDEVDFKYTGRGLGMFSAVVDVDLDGLPELVRHDRVAGWDPDATEWVDKSWWAPDPPEPRAGHIGVADAGLYSALDGLDPAQLPEVVIVSASSAESGDYDTGSIRMTTVTGELVWGPILLYQGDAEFAGRGGAPTISDFDGDGQVEFAAAAAYYYAVYDPDCDSELGGASPPERPGGTCERSEEMADMPDGVLWAQPSQDFTSNTTGSSIFDFDGDGTGEVVYRDECWLRVYNGATGEVLFSRSAYSSTGLEYPVIADVDGDFATEIVVTRGSDIPDVECPPVDPLFPGSGPFEADATGFVVFRDPEDRWASSRPIWNQHVYSVTHVRDDARVLKSSEVEANWLVEGLNNFRQNTQGPFGLFPIADLTVELAELDALCPPQPGEHEFAAEVCNRGTAPAPPGITVEFLETAAPDEPAEQGALVCGTATTQELLPDECELVGCVGVLQGGGNLFVKVDPEGELADCHPNNNTGPGALTLCPEP